MVIKLLDYLTNHESNMEAPKEIYLTFTNNGHIVESDEPILGNQSIKYICADIAELTWKDIKLICEIEDRYWNEEFENGICNSLEEYYTEVLRRFNEKKNEKT